MRHLAIAAFAAAILLLFAGCDAGDGAGNDYQYTETDVVEPTPDTEVDPCTGNPKADNPACTTPDVESDPEVTEPDVIETPVVLTDCDYWSPIEGYWDVDDGWDFEIGQFELKSGRCIAEGDPQLGVPLVVGDPTGIEANEIVACGSNLETPAICMRLNDDGSLTMWGNLIGDEPYTIPPR